MSRACIASVQIWCPVQEKKHTRCSLDQATSVMKMNLWKMFKKCSKRHIYNLIWSSLMWELKDAQTCYTYRIIHPKKQLRVVCVCDSSLFIFKILYQFITFFNSVCESSSYFNHTYCPVSPTAFTCVLWCSLNFAVGFFFHPSVFRCLTCLFII